MDTVNGNRRVTYPVSRREATDAGFSECLETGPMASPRRMTMSDIINDIRSTLTPLLKEISITDVPGDNSYGLMYYKYDENHARVRERRLAVAKAFDLTLGDAAADRRFQLSLASRVAEERDLHNKLFGQCAEMAYLAAMKLEHIAQMAGYNVYSFQQPNKNHTLILFSKNQYYSGERINWQKEKATVSLIVDLWQGVLSANNPSALVSYSFKNRYGKINTLSIVQAEIWRFSRSVNESRDKSPKIGGVFKSVRNIFS